MDKITTTDLMQPRIIVENNYPRSPFKHHEIICQPSWQQIEWAKEFTLNFRFLDWWEFRDQSDMPEYVKIPHYPNGENDYEIVHVDGDFISHDFTAIGYFGLEYKNGGGLIHSCFTPSTFEEYNEYKKQATNIK